MRKRIILVAIQISLIVLQPLASSAQVMPHVPVHPDMSSPNIFVPGQHHDPSMLPMHHQYGSENNQSALQIQHHFWQHTTDAQYNKHQQEQVNLNLSSSNTTMTAGHLLNGQAISINVSGQQISVTSNTLLTSAEYMAVMQVAHTGQQTILLNSQGDAISGTAVINSRLSSELSGLVVPKGVTVIDLTSSGRFNLSGGVVDSGNLYVASVNPLLNSLSIKAGDISVLSGGLLSDVLSPNLLPLLSRVDANLNLNLNSLTTISNAGTIQAANNLNMTAGSSNITNTGLIQANQGNINVLPSPNTAAQALNLSSAGGTWQATNGNINLGYVAGTNISANESLNLNLTGGNYLSQQLNISLGNGALTAAIQNVSGVVSADAGAARIVASTPNLQIGNWNIAGDPTIANDNTITLTGSILTDGAPVTIVSGQNVVSYIPIAINTSSASGGNVNIIAGATFTPDPYSSGPISILGASATGGSINLNLNSGGINTQALASNSAGGNVILAAFAGGVAGSGTIVLPSSSTISTGGMNTGSPGHVYVIAGANTGSAANPGISIGNINTVTTNETGGPGGSGLAGGHIVLATEQPNASINNPWTIDPSSGTTLVGGPLGGAIANAPISVNSVTTGGGQLIIFSGMGITVGNNSTIGTNVISTVPATGTIFPGGAVSLIANAYGNTSPAINTDIVVNGNIVSSGPVGGNTGSPQSGEVLLMTTGSVTVGNIITSNISPTGLSFGGSVFIVAGSNFTNGNITVGNINTSGQQAQAGSVEIVSMGTYGNNAGTINIGSINTSSTNASGNFITISSPGAITVSGAVNSSGGNGNGGSLFIGSGAQSGTAISVANGSTINVSGSVLGGGVYLLAGNAGDTIINGTTTGASSTAISAYNPNMTSITGSAGAITISFGTTTSFANYAPGGYFQINDQVGTAGGVQLIITTSGDPNVSVPLVSLNSPLTILGAPGSSSLLQSAHGALASGYSLLSPEGIFVGGNNATIFSLGSVNNIGVIASNHGTVDINNNSSLQKISVGLASSASGPLFILNNATTILSDTVSASSITLGAGSLLGLTLTDSVTSASTITLTGLSSSPMTVTQSGPGTVEGATLNIVNLYMPLNGFNAQTTLYTDVANLNVDTSNTSVVSISNSDNVNVSVPQAASFSLSTGGQINVTAPSAATTEFSLSTSGNIAISQNITVTGADARIDLKSASTIIIGDGVVVNASGTSSSGGLLQLASSITNGPLTVLNNGIIIASNTDNSSIVGFNSGGSLIINVTGGGAIVGSEVNFGNLSSSSLQMQGPFEIITSPLTSSFNYGNIHIQQGFVLATAGFIRISDPITLGSWSFNSYAQQNQLTALYEQIGTRIATDYTPWTTYWRQPILYSSPSYPLKGGISVNKPVASGQALFAASAFNANELNALSRQGIVFGPNTRDNFFELRNGYMLFIPKDNIHVQTSEGLVIIPKGAQVWIMKTGTEVAIYDLHDDLFTGPVRAIANNKEFVLSPGKELLLTTNKQESFDVLNPGKQIAYRAVCPTDLGAGINAYVADFSIKHGLMNVAVINKLFTSKDPSQRKAAHQMAKNASILAQLAGDNYPE